MSLSIYAKNARFDWYGWAYKVSGMIRRAKLMMNCLSEKHHHVMLYFKTGNDVFCYFFSRFRQSEQLHFSLKMSVFCSWKH